MLTDMFGLNACDERGVGSVIVSFFAVGTPRRAARSWNVCCPDGTATVVPFIVTLTFCRSEIIARSAFRSVRRARFVCPPKQAAPLSSLRSWTHGHHTRIISTGQFGAHVRYGVPSSAV